MTPSRFALVGLLVNVLLAGVKLFAGIVGHSYALVADAVESMTDIVGSMVIWGGLRYGARPPDESHPFGHGKAESLAALAVGGMVVIAGVAIAINAVREILTPHHAPAPFTLVVLVAVIVVKEVLYRIANRVAQDADSTAIRADAFHHRADAITSFAALVGISIALWGGPGWEPADDWAALVASGVIVFNGWRLAREPLGELLDRQPEALPPRIEAIARAVPGVRFVEKIRVLKHGPTHGVDLHVQVDPHLSVRDGHAVGGAVKAAIRSTLRGIGEVLIHLEPFEDKPLRPEAAPRLTEPPVTEN